MSVGFGVRAPTANATVPTMAADLEEIVSRTSGVMTVYPAYPRWTISHFADDRILLDDYDSGAVVTIHIGITATSSARTVARDVWQGAVDHLMQSGKTALPTVQVKVCSIG